ncbi:quinone oxidoreductase family protein [Caulobacter sp. KR2-114]|uniref:quinone oxidoreductase family protein n=1 Tax=Caulobacter sp. KR2-114 TaxID=3400912 RepID=UPI003C035893
MKAAVVEEAGRLPVYADFAEPVAGPAEVVVQVTASALSQLARGRAAGAHYSATGEYPFVAGVDGVGRLEDGQRVYFLLPRAPFGAMAQRTVVSDGQWAPLPDELDDVMAAVLANPGMSSWAALTERARLSPGETVLINGATGTAGRLAVKIARHLGAARVIATGRNLAVLQTLDADATVPLSQDEDAIEAILRAHFADGVDVVLDYLWGASARSILATAAKAGPAGVPIRFVQIGAAAGPEIALPAAVLRSSAIEMKGSGLGSVGLPRLMAAIDGVFRAASVAGLTLDYDAVPLAEVSSQWATEGRRVVFLPD